MITGFTVQWNKTRRTLIPGTARRMLPGGHTRIDTPHGPVILLRGTYRLCWPVSDRDQLEEAE